MCTHAHTHVLARTQTHTLRLVVRCRRVTHAQIVRSASFGRRSKQLKQPAAAEEVEATDIDEMSRSATPDTDHAPDSPEDPQRASPPNLAELEAETGPMEPQLYGWLKKRHHTGSWAKRYFFVDETRGTLGYSKGVKGRSSKPSGMSSRICRSSGALPATLWRDGWKSSRFSGSSS